MQERKRGGLSGVQRAQVVKEMVGWGGIGEAPADSSGMMCRPRGGSKCTDRERSQKRGARQQDCKGEV